MTMRYLDVALHDLQREFQPARLVPQPRVPFAPLRAGSAGVIDSLRPAQHVLEMVRRALPNGPSSRRLTAPHTRTNRTQLMAHFSNPLRHSAL